MALVVVGGGRRCGKSRYACALAQARGSRLGFLATLEPYDNESALKIDSARGERGTAFITIEEPLSLLRVVEERLEHFDALVVDDLTIWVSNMALAGRDDDETEMEAVRLADLASQSPAELIIVTSDVDFGFRVDGEPSRRFRRLAGLINRRMAEAASRLYWMVFGVPERIR